MPSSRPAWPPSAELGRFVACSVCFALSLGVGDELARAQTPAPGAPHATPDSPAGHEDAAPSLVLLLVRSRGDAGVMSRLRAEIEPSAYSLVELRPDERRGATELGQIAEQQRATAAIRFDADSGTMKLWVSRPGGAVSETISSQDARLSDWVLVLRTTEALRAHGLDLGPKLPESEPAAVASAPEPDVAGGGPRAVEGDELRDASRRERELGVDLGASADLSPGGVPLQLQLQGGLYLRTGSAWTVKAMGWYPLLRSRLSGLEGKARVRTWLAGASVDAAVLQESTASLAFGAGYALVVHTMKGDAAAGYRGARDRVVSSGPFARADVRLQLGSSLRLDLMTLIGLSLPELTVEFSQRSAARWGRPFVALGLGFESAAVDF